MTQRPIRRKNRDAIVSRETIIIQPPRLGTYWHGQGGIYVGVMPGENGLPDYHLIAADERGEIDRINWADQADHQPGALSVIDGLANTIALRASTIRCQAALWTAGIEIDGHKDFYLPAKNEAMICCIDPEQLFEKKYRYWTSTQNARSADSGVRKIRLFSLRQRCFKAVQIKSVPVATLI